MQVSDAGMCAKGYDERVDVWDSWALVLSRVIDVGFLQEFVVKRLAKRPRATKQDQARFPKLGFPQYCRQGVDRA